MASLADEDDGLEGVSARLALLQATLEVVRGEFAAIDMYAAKTKFSNHVRLERHIRRSGLALALASLEIAAHCPVDHAAPRVRVHLPSCAPRLVNTAHSLGQVYAAWHHRYPGVTYLNMAWWLASFALPTSVYPTAAAAPSIIPRSSPRKP